MRQRAGRAFRRARVGPSRRRAVEVLADDGGREAREEADAAVERLEIHELPSARGCTYVVPMSDFAIALKVGVAFSGGEMKTAAKLGVTEKEIDKLCDAVLKAVAKGPLDPDGIREAT